MWGIVAKIIMYIGKEAIASYRKHREFQMINPGNPLHDKTKTSKVKEL